jgi:dTDP-4-amino-4,6-dideoxygalactose transaminase
MYIIGDEETQAVKRVIDSGKLYRYCTAAEGGLEEVINFEKEWAEFCGTKHAVSTSSGTSALVCALAGAGIGPGDEVIVPGYTFVATALAVLQVGAIPVVVDIDESNTIDVESVKQHLSPRTRCVIPVHMCGMPCNMEPLLELCAANEILLLEDACQAAGGEYRGKKLGTLGDVGVFSFNMYKIISAGESGAVITDDKKLFERAYVKHDGGCFLREQIQFLQEAVFAGENYRNNEISAAILRVQLKRLPDILASLRKSRARFANELKETESIRLAPSYDAGGDCGVQLLVNTDSEERTRRLIDLLLQNGVFGMTPIDSGRHVYANWEPLMDRIGGHHPALDPFKMEANRQCAMEYGPEMLPKTLDVLKRSVQVVIGVGWSDDMLDGFVAGLNRAVEEASA